MSGTHGQKCVLCHVTQFDNFLHNLHDREYGMAWSGEIRKCVACGLIQQYPMPTVKEAVALYPDAYVQYNPQPNTVKGKLLRLSTKPTINLLKELGAKPGKTLLDIGCGGGELLAAIRDALRLKVLGVEPNERAVANAVRTFGLEVKAGVFPRTDIPSESFDFVRINHVVEHVPDPLGLINNIHRALKPGGWLIGETENIDCLSFKVFNQYWALLHVPYHLLFFTKDTLQVLFYKSLFHTSNVHDTSHPTLWSLSLQNVLRRNKVINPGTPPRMRGYIFITMLSLPLGWLEKLFGQGPILQFWVQKGRTAFQ